jgi:hypothetical protein
MTGPRPSRFDAEIEGWSLYLPKIAKVGRMLIKSDGAGRYSVNFNGVPIVSGGQSDIKDWLIHIGKPLHAGVARTAIKYIETRYNQAKDNEIGVLLAWQAAYHKSKPKDKNGNR